MSEIVKPRYEIGDDFYDAVFYEGYKTINYPDDWIEEGRNYSKEDSYVMSHPSWFLEEMPSIPNVSIYEMFKKVVEKSPDDIAVIFFDKKITYKDLDLLIGKYAALLQKLGVKQGDMVATMLPNSLQHIVAFYAAVMIGAIHTPINVMYQPGEIDYQLKDSGAKTILILDVFYGKIKKLHDEKRVDNVIVTSLHDFASEKGIISDAIKPLFDFPKNPIPETLDMFEEIETLSPVNRSFKSTPKEDIALLLYTAGTTGFPKGVVITHFNLVFNSLSHTHAFKTWKDEVNFSIMPMFHSSGYFLHLLPTMYQGGIVIPIPMFDLKDAFRIIETYGVNVIFAPPTLYVALLSQKELREEHDISSLNSTIACGAPVPPAIQENWLKLTGIRLVSGWGMTETNSGGILSIPRTKEKSEALGVPIFSEAKIVDVNGDIAPRNTEGEICYRGLQLAVEYLNKEKQTKEAFLDDGWFKTGDRGIIDNEDFVHFVDRIKDLIITSGYNVAPTEIENVIYQLPVVAEVAVVGIPDAYKGETIKAFIALKPDSENITEQEIIDFCRERLATYKVPKVVEFMKEIPKSAVGKILRRAVRDEA